MTNKEMMELRPEFDEKFKELVKYCMDSGVIDSNLYIEYDVKRGLRDSNGKGVLTGLTEISDVVAFDIVDGERVPCDGRLYFQGYDVYDLIEKGDHRRFAFEEATYLLLFGKLPTEEQLNQFIDILGDLRELSGHFLRDVIMKAPSANIMNALQKSIITLYSYDDYAECIDNLDDWNSLGYSVVYRTFERTNLLLSPSVVAMMQGAVRPFATFARNSFRTTTLTLNGKFVGRQYLDNTSSPDRMVPAYFVMNLSLTHEFPLKGGVLGIGGYVNNLLNRMYYADGGAWKNLAVAENTFVSGVYIYPQAPANFLLKLYCRF